MWRKWKQKKQSKNDVWAKWKHQKKKGDRKSKNKPRGNSEIEKHIDWNEKYARGIQSRSEQAEEWINEFEVRTMKIIESGEHKEKKIEKKWTEPNKCIVGVPEEKTEKGKHNIWRNNV